MENNNIGSVLGEMGCKFRSNIETQIEKRKQHKGDDAEWLLDPLDELSHPVDYVLDAYLVSSRWDSHYKLYFHLRNAKDIYIPYDETLSWLDEQENTKTDGYTAHMLGLEQFFYDDLKPKPFDKSMMIKGALDYRAAHMIPEIWDELVVPFTTFGIWQAVLLHQTITLFPKGWHAAYMDNIYVYSLEDMEEIIKHHKRGSYDFDHEKLATYLNRDDIMPAVEIDGDKAIASYFYWNDWSGFCRMIIPIEKHGHSIKFGEFESETHVKYDCRIRY